MFLRNEVRVCIILGLIALLLVTTGLSAASAEPSPPQEERPFIMPFAGPPGPDTWFFLQAYGNTTFAYRFRNNVYFGGQGLHFGLDLAAPCGTPVRAIGDGVVHSVDSWHGAGPHNLLINHSNGYASFYGHLLVRSRMKVGEKVVAGDIVALSGDPDLTCVSRPHIHLEIRDSETHARAYNPLNLIEADWERLALIGGEPMRFEMDMENPTRWTDLFDQPETRFGHPLVNDYASPWPYDW